MVKYLGVDYLKLAISQKQQFLNQALIAVPEHLEVVDLYTHCGKLEDERYRYPWKRASCDSGFLNDERSKASTLEMIVPDIRSGDGVEKYDCDSEDEELGYFDLNDFVPSSNPDSPLANNIQHSENSTGIMETHRKLDLEDGNNSCIEEPLDQDLFSSVKKNLPSLKCLTERLHQSQIKDPFLAKTKNIIENSHCLRLTGSELIEKPHNKELFSEDFNNITIYDGDYLEELLSPFEDVQKEKLQEKPCVLTDLKKIASTDSVTDEMPFPPSIVNLNQHAEILQKEDSNTEKKESFLNINGIGDDDDEINETKALLDSPVITPTPATEPRSLHIKSILQPLTRLEINKGSNFRFLSNGEVVKLESKIWQKEKYFCDILSLRLTEPDVEAQSDLHISLKSVIEQLKWVKKESVSDIELSLNWDPVGHISTSRNIIEKINIDKTEVKWEVKRQEEKFTCHKLVDWEDGVIEMTETKKDLQVNGSENKVLEFGTSIVGLETKHINTVEDFGFDQIDDFFALRFGKKAERKQAQVTSGHMNKGPKEEIKDISSSNNSIHYEIVSVQLGDKFQDIITTIEKKLSYLQSALKAAKVTLPNEDLSALNTDFSRFLLKQTEKQMLDSAENEEIEGIYKSVVCLHALVGARDILYNYCLESAIAHLQAVEEKYKSGVTAGIEDIRQRLFQLSSSFQQKKFYHPKVVTTSVEIEKCLNSKGNLKRKVLVIIKRNLPSFLSVLKEVASHSPAVRFKVQEDSQTESIINSLEEYNCIVMTESLITSDFPWSLFNLVIEYQYEEQTEFCRICEKHNLKLKALKLELKKISGNHEQQEMQVATVTSSIDNLSQRSIIGSTQLTACGDVLPLLETRYNLTVIERNYNIFDKSVFADIDMTDRSGIILHSMKELSDEIQMEMLLKKIISLSVKYTKCWILLYNLNKTAKSYPYAGKYVRNLCKLQASLGNYVARHDSFEAKILSCCTTEEACSCIRIICDTEMNFSDIWNSDEWRDGKWLKEYPNKEEKLLLTLPCINSISSQILLKKLTLKELILLSQEDLIRMFPMIARRLLLELYSILHSNQGLNSRLDGCKVNSKPIKQNTTSQRIVIENWNDSQIEEKTENENWEAVDNLNHEKSINKQSECQKDLPDKLLKERISKHNRLLEEEHNHNDCILVHQNSKKLPQSYSSDTSDMSKHFDNRQMDSFPEKRYKLKFGRSHSSITDTCELHQAGLYHGNYPNEEKDTQDTDDVLSLNGSQSSVMMNEFEKAEIEGNVNRVCNEEREHLLKNDDINNMLTRHNNPDEISDIRFEEINPRYSHKVENKPEYDPRYLKYQYSNEKDRNKHEIDHKYLQYSNAEVRNKHEFDTNLRTDYNQYGISNYHSEESERSFCRSKDIIENPEIMIYGSQHVGGQKVDMFPDNAKSQYSTPNDSRGTSSAKKGGENRSFTQDLSETTRNILKQAYQSPRFGVRPTRPFTQRISVGLAQPLRRETTSKISSDDRNTHSRLHTSTTQNNTAIDRMSNLRQSQRDILEHPEYISEFDRSMYCEGKLQVQGETPSYSPDIETVEKENRRGRSQEYRSNNSSRSEQSKYFNDRTNTFSFQKVQQAKFENHYDDNDTRHTRHQSCANVNTQFPESDYCYSENYQHYRTNNRQDSKLSGSHGTGFELQSKTLKTPRKLVARTEQDREHMTQTPRQLVPGTEKEITYRTQTPRQFVAPSEHERTYRPQRQWQNYDSPPMDLDYLDEMVDRQMLKQQHGYPRDSLVREASVDMTNRMYLTNDRSVPNKKRKLAYQRQPGSRGGQTKLVFK